MINERRCEPCADPKKKDKLYARLPVFARRVNRAKEIIREGLQASSRPYVAFSGGKDSEVVLHLVIQEKPDIPVVWFHQGAEFPDTEDIVKRLAKEWNLNLHIEHVKPDLLDLLEEYGAYGTQVRSEYKNGDIARRLIYEPAARLAKENEFDGVFMGLRREESRGRSYVKPCRLVKYDGLWHINPLYGWKKEDVWAYLTVNELPYNAVYDKTKFRSRDDIRVSPWAGGKFKTYGRFVELKYYYPDLFNEFAGRFPGVRKYV